MAKYIDREALVELIDERNRNTCNGALSCLQLKRMALAIPAADVAPVRRGMWEKAAWWQHQNRYECNECSVCGCRVKPKFTYNYCPHCGADMREEEQDG